VLDALVRVTRAAICGSDLWFYRGITDLPVKMPDALATNEAKRDASVALCDVMLSMWSRTALGWRNRRDSTR